MNRQKENMMELLQAVTYAFGAYSRCFQKNQTSGALFETFLKALREKLVDFEIKYDYIWGQDSLHIDGVTALDYIPQDNDTVIMDISVGKNDLWCDVCRTFFVGNVTKEQAHIFELIKQSVRVGEKKLAATQKSEEVYKAVHSVYEGENKKLIHHAGHRIGKGPLLEPRFVLNNCTEIQCNKFYTIESGCYESFGIRLENVYWVGENQTENLFEPLMNLNVEEYQLYAKKY